MGNAMHSFAEGDSVLVRPGVEHPGLGTDLGGWQGWITEILLDEIYGELVSVEWDSLTLQQMPPEFIEQAETAGLDWTRTYLVPIALQRAEPRDKPVDATEVAEQLSDVYEWEELGAQGKRIREIVAGVPGRNEGLKRWVEFLGNNLDFPFAAEVATFREQGPLQQGDRIDVRRISLVDQKYGILVGVRYRSLQYALPLHELEVEDEMSPNYQMVQDYASWFDRAR